MSSPPGAVDALSHLSSAESDAVAKDLLACLKCHAHLGLGDGASKCPACGESLFIKDGVVVARETSTPSYFDDIYQVMQTGNHTPGTWDLFYQRQVAAVESLEGGCTLHAAAGAVDSWDLA